MPTANRKFIRHELLEIGADAVELRVQVNPRARRIIVKVHPATGEVRVVIPPRAGLKSALAFARGHSAWIARQLARVPPPVALAPGASVPFEGVPHAIRAMAAGPAPVWREADGSVLCVTGRVEHAPRRLLDFLKSEAKKTLALRANEFAGRIGVKPSRIAVRDTASRWGSCSSARSLSFSWRLILAPPFVLDYVVAHEVAHLREMNHGARFWAHVESLVGDLKPPQDWLAEHGSGLQRYAPAR